MGYKDKMSDMRGELRVMNKAIPDTMKSFGALEKSVKDNATLDHKQLEWVALGMAMIARCEPCINFHVGALMKAGGTREELADICAMAIQMGGGPGMMYAGHAMACWDELAGES